MATTGDYSKDTDEKKGRKASLGYAVALSNDGKVMAAVSKTQHGQSSRRVRTFLYNDDADEWESIGLLDFIGRTLDNGVAEQFEQSPRRDVGSIPCGCYQLGHLPER